MASLTEPNMSKLEILGAAQSPLVWAVRMVAAEKGLDAEHTSVSPHSPEVDAIQPFGKIPVLRHGGVEIGESRAIALYLDGLAERTPLVPCDLAGAARAEQWIMHFHTEYFPLLVGRYVVAYFFPRGPGGAPDRAAIEAALPAMDRAIGILGRRLAGRDYLAGAFTLADVFFAPTLHYTSVLPEGARMVAAAPQVAAYLSRLSARPAFRATFPPLLPNRAAA